MVSLIRRGCSWFIRFLRKPMEPIAELERVAFSGRLLRLPEEHDVVVVLVSRRQLQEPHCAFAPVADRLDADARAPLVMRLAVAVMRGSAIALQEAKKRGRLANGHVCVVGFSTGRSACQSVAPTSAPSESCTSGRGSFGGRGSSSPRQNMLVSGAIPRTGTGCRKNRCASTSTTVSFPGLTTKR